jgi:hypothetical protein
MIKKVLPVMLVKSAQQQARQRDTILEDEFLCTPTPDSPPHDCPSIVRAISNCQIRVMDRVANPCSKKIP